MQGRIEDFFIPDNEVRHVEELNYGRIEEYVRAAEAFSRTTYQSVYVIDYFRKNFLYVSPNPMFLCGLSSKEMKDLGYRFYLDFVPPEDRALLLDINRAGFAFLRNLPAHERKDWYIQYDFNIENNGRRVLVNHKLTPLALTSDGSVWLALCVVSASSHTSSGHVELHKAGSPEYFEYNPKTRRMNKRTLPTLTDGEKSVITLSIQGYTMTEIAERICLSPDTIKKYRRQIFEKLDVHNISEAIMAAANNKLI